MRLLGKTAVVVGLAGAMALGSMTASQARFRAGPAIAAGIAGFAIGAAAANANAGYYPYGYDGYGYGGYGYDSYAYAPGYVEPGYGTPSYYGPVAPYSSYTGNYSYNSNTVSPMRERQLKGQDY